jgi:hypothetical protein
MSTDDVSLTDAKTAGQLKVTRSLALFTGGLATVAAAAAILTFVLGAFHHVGWFLLVLLVAFVCAFISIYQGAQGVRAIYLDGFDHKWEKNTGNTQLNLQAIFLMLAAIFTAASPGVAYGTAKTNSNPLETAISTQATATNRLASDYLNLVKNDLQSQQAEIAHLTSSNRHLQTEINAVRRRIAQLARDR